MDEYKGTVAKDRLMTIEQIKELPTKAKVKFGAVITGIQEITTAKTKQKMAFLTLEDTTGVVDGVVFTSMYPKFKEMLEYKVPLRFEGSLEVTESEEERTVKVSLFKIDILEKKSAPQSREIEEWSIPAVEAGKLTNVKRGKSKGLRMTFEFADGTKAKCLETIYVDQATRRYED